MTRAMQETMMTPRSRKPVLLVSGTNINTFNQLDEHPSSLTVPMDDVIETSESSDEDSLRNQFHSLRKSKSESELLGCSQKIPKINKNDKPHELSQTFKEYLHNRGIFALSQDNLSTSSYTHVVSNIDFNNISSNEMTDSLMYCLDGNHPNDIDMEHDTHEEKQLILKPKQFDKDGKAIIFETSF